MATGIIAAQAQNNGQKLSSVSIDIQDKLQEALWIGALAGWIEVARAHINQIKHAASYDNELANLLKKHDIAASAAYWDTEESTALTMLLASQLGFIRTAMTHAGDVANV